MAKGEHFLIPGMGLAGKPLKLLDMEFPLVRDYLCRDALGIPASRLRPLWTLNPWGDLWALDTDINLPFFLAK